jgi:hypothetical protein
MRRLQVVMSAALGVCLVAPLAQAQVKPVGIAVTTKTEREAQRTTSGIRNTCTGTTSQTVKVKHRTVGVTYNIELANQSTKTLNGLKVQWAIADDSKILAQGTSTCSLALGQRFAIQTDRVSPNAKGYLVEIYDGDKLIASHADPPDFKDVIERFRARTEGPGQKKSKNSG